MGTQSLWMRGSISFVALRELLIFVAQHPEGVRPKDMEIWAREVADLRTQAGRPVSKTTVYHYRNTLLHLGLLKQTNRRYIVAQDEPEVHNLLQALTPGKPVLSTVEREMFAKFVVTNTDCRQYFFDLFMPENSSNFDLQMFLQQGTPVAWKRVDSPEGRIEHLCNLSQPMKECWIRSEDERQAILYGVRYWARNELGFLEEVFLEDVGGLMFPVHLTGPVPDPNVLQALQETINMDQEWTVISVRTLAATWGPQYRISLERLHRTLLWVYHRFSEYVVLIPTAEAFATITASSPGTEKYQLRGYLQDPKGRYISHIRVHRKLKGVISWPVV